LLVFLAIFFQFFRTASSPRLRESKPQGFFAHAFRIGMRSAYSPICTSRLTTGTQPLNKVGYDSEVGDARAFVAG
jgi:hypothetical protein